MHLGVMGHQGLSDITEMLVRGELWKLVTGYQTYGLVGVSPLGEGPETWFAEAVLEHGGALEVLGAPARPGSALLRRARAVHRLAPGLDLTDTMLGLVDELRRGLGRRTRHPPGCLRHRRPHPRPPRPPPLARRLRPHRLTRVRGRPDGLSGAGRGAARRYRR